MTPRRGDAADLAGVRHRETDQSRERPEDSTTKSYIVVIVAGEKRGTWGTFADVESAAAVAARLRRYGMIAAVEQVAT